MITKEAKLYKGSIWVSRDELDPNYYILGLCNDSCNYFPNIENVKWVFMSFNGDRVFSSMTLDNALRSARGSTLNLELVSYNIKELITGDPYIQQLVDMINSL